MFSSASNNNLGINFPTGGYGIHWGTGYSRIYDDTHLRICTDDTMHFYTGSTTSSPGTERITMLQNGNIGMGITSPNVNLEVAGTMRIGNNAALNNKLLVLYDNNTSDSLLTATNFYGFGINSYTLRYQVNAAEAVHKFYCGSDMRMQIGTTNQTRTIITSQTGVYETYWPSGWGGLATRDICGMTIYATTVNQRSDVRKKQDIVDYTRGL
jgi:hypothetical protein